MIKAKKNIRLAITGACGKMGSIISELAFRDKRFDVTALIEEPENHNINKIINGVEIVKNINEVIEKFDILIDFTTQAHSYSNMEICSKHRKGIIIGTTGLEKTFFDRAKELSLKIPVLISSNMSIGVNVLIEVVKHAAEMLPRYDIEIIEYHHKYKKDSPSGTAISLAKNILEVKGGDLEKDIVYQRHGDKLSRKEGSIGIQSLRAGDIIGDHEIVFAANNEVIKISHHAGNRSIFASGALEAAVFLGDKNSGLYTMKNVLGI